jgi:hypothetical protein
MGQQSNITLIILSGPWAFATHQTASTLMNNALLNVISAENKGRLWEREVLGYPVWPLERLNCYQRELLKEHNYESTDPQLFYSSNRMGRQVRTFFDSIKDVRSRLSQRHDHRDIWVFGASSYRRKDASGVYQCVFAEHLRKQCGDRLLFFERNSAGLTPQNRDDLVFIDSLLNPIQFGSLALGKALSRVYPLDPDVRDAFEPISGAEVYRSALYGRAMLAIARAWLRRARPSAVFVLCAYHLYIPWQIAIRECGIPLIELQHGVIHEFHPGYILSDNPALNYLPHHIVVFGRHFGELLERECSYWKNRWTVGGHPWLKQQRKAAEQIREADRNVVAVFTSRDSPVRDIFTKLIPQLRRVLDPRLRIVIKAHPLETDAEQFYQHLLGPGVELAGPRDDSYALLGYCRLAVNIASTVAIEALAYSCRSAVLSSDLWTDDIRALVRQGVLDQVETAEDLARLAFHDQSLADREIIADRLFGINEPEPDFLEIIDRSKRAAAF